MRTRIFVAGLRALILLGLLLPLILASGCASTTLERGEGGVRYNSTKDISIGRAEWREWYADGKPKSEFILDNSGGNASAVNAANWQGANQMAQLGFQLGAQAARVALGLPPTPIAEPSASSSSAPATIPATKVPTTKAAPTDNTKPDPKEPADDSDPR